MRTLFSGLGATALFVALGCGGMTTLDAEAGGWVSSGGIGASWSVPDPLGATAGFGAIAGLGGTPTFGGTSTAGGSPESGATGGAVPPTRCTPLSTAISGNYCHVPYACERGHLGLVCDIQPEDVSPCTCTGSMATVEYRLLGANGDPCEHATAWCPTLPSFGDPATCEPVFRTEFREGCEATTDCTWSTALGDGVTLQYTETDNISCTVDDGRWECTCSGPRYRRILELPGAPTSRTACNEARTICLEAAPQSEREACRITHQYTDIEYCDSDLECERTGTHGGSPIVYLESFRTACNLRDDAWECECEPPEGPVTVELDASVSARDACSTAPIRCLERLDAAERER